MPPRVLHLISTLGPTAVGRAASNLIPHLPADQRHAIHFGARFFPTSAVAISGRGLFPLGTIRELRNIFRKWNPDLIHCWGSKALAWTTLLPKRRVVASHLPEKSNWLLRRPMKFVARVLSTSELISVETQELHTKSNVILMAGRYDHNAQMALGPWAFDIVRKAIAGYRLVMIGDGPLRYQSVDRSQTLQQHSNQVQYITAMPEIHAWLARTAFVWVTQKTGGESLIAEAHAHRAITIGHHPSCRIPSPFHDPVHLAKVTVHAIEQKIIFDFPIPPTPETVASRLTAVYHDVASQR